MVWTLACGKSLRGDQTQLELKWHQVMSNIYKVVEEILNQKDEEEAHMLFQSNCLSLRE